MNLNYKSTWDLYHMLEKSSENLKTKGVMLFKLMMAVNVFCVIQVIGYRILTGNHTMSNFKAIYSMQVLSILIVMVYLINWYVPRRRIINELKSRNIKL